jgi:hypothetical protein
VLAIGRLCVSPLDHARHDMVTKTETNVATVILTGAVIIYASLWGLTQRVGAPQVRKIAVDSFHFPASFTDVTHTSSRDVRSPAYYCRAVAWAPFLVRIEYDWESGPLTGDGGRVLYLCIFGASFRLWQYAHWAT